MSILKNFQVSSEWKPFLIQSLKKSSFWSQNSRHYPNLTALIAETENNSVNPSSTSSSTLSLLSNNFNSKNLNKKLKIDEMYEEEQRENEESKEKDDSEEESSSEEEKQRNLIRFVQRQQEELSRKNKNFTETITTTIDKTKMAIHNNSSSLDLSLSSSSLLSAFSKLTSSLSSNAVNLNSDLEMEVASTLVGMKFCNRA